MVFSVLPGAPSNRAFSRHADGPLSDRLPPGTPECAQLPGSGPPLLPGVRVVVLVVRGGVLWRLRTGAQR
jgi:hypothetical protein